MTTTVISRGPNHWVPHNEWDLVVPAQGRPPGSAVAIIVPYFEQPDSLLRMYAAIGAARLDPFEHELIVVDDGSSQPPPQPPEELGLAVRILNQPDRGCRPGAARNLGAASTDAELLVFFDSDTLPEPQTIGLLASWPEAMPDALVVGRRGHADLAGWSPAETEAWLSGFAAPPARGDDPTWLEEGYRSSRNLLDVDDRSYRYVISAVMACHRSLYDDVGGFDPARDEYGSEDWEFASRAFNNGAVLIHEPDAIAWHDEPDWAGRDGRLAAKNRETLYLSAATAEPLTRGPGLIHHHPDTVALVELRPNTSDSQVVATIHCLLGGIFDINVHLPSDVPDAVRRHVEHDPRVHLGPPTSEELLRCRTVVRVYGPAYWSPERLRSIVDEVRPGGPGLITVDHDGDKLAAVASTRALGRVRRAAMCGIDENSAMTGLFGHDERSADAAGIHRLNGEVDLAAYFGGWATHGS